MSSKRGEKADISISKRAPRSCRGFLRSVKDRLGARLRSIQRYVANRLRALSLFWAIFCCVVLALLMFTALGGVWGEGGWWSNWQGVGVSSTPLDVIKASLTTIGGVGGTAYLVIRYRERASAERAEAEHKLLNAVQQLGSESPQVRIAGVYALADVADTYRGGYRQRVVNILCGYLRTQRGEWKTIVNEQDRPKQSSEEKVYVSQDGAVESTVLEVLGRHLRKRRENTDTHDAVTQDVDDDQLWCDCTIDLHDAVISEHAKLDHLSLEHKVDFQSATFLKAAEFTQTAFTYADFSGSHFKNVTSFNGASFEKSARFQHCQFRRRANLRVARFNCSSDFRHTHFHGETEFGDVRFESGADFRKSKFSANSDFTRTYFSCDSNFRAVEFVAPTSFDFVRFDGKADFMGVRSSESISFQAATFVGPVMLAISHLRGYSDLQDATFLQSANFSGTHFSGHLTFSRSNFVGEVLFFDSNSSASTNFMGCHFNDRMRHCSKQSIVFPDSFSVDEDTGLPPGASWARFDDKGNVIEVLPSERPSPDDEPNDAS